MIFLITVIIALKINWKAINLEKIPYSTLRNLFNTIHNSVASVIQASPHRHATQSPPVLQLSLIIPLAVSSSLSHASPLHLQNIHAHTRESLSLSLFAPVFISPRHSRRSIIPSARTHSYRRNGFHRYFSLCLIVGRRRSRSRTEVRSWG